MTVLIDDKNSSSVYMKLRVVMTPWKLTFRSLSVCWLVFNLRAAESLKTSILWNRMHPSIKSSQPFRRSQFRSTRFLAFTKHCEISTCMYASIASRTPYTVTTRRKRAPTFSLFATPTSPTPEEVSSLFHLSKLSKMLMILTSLIICSVSSPVGASHGRKSYHYLATQLGGASGFGLAAYSIHILQRYHRNKSSAITSASDDAGSNYMFEEGQRLEANEAVQMQLDALHGNLHFGVFLFCLLGIPFLPAEAGLFGTAPPALATALIMTLARISGLWTLFSIWRQSQSFDGMKAAGATEWKEIKNDSIILSFLNDFGRRMRYVLQSLRSKEPKKSLLFRNAFLLVSFGAFSNLMQGFFEIRYRGAFANSFSPTSTTLSFSAFARLTFLSSLLYSLKTGSESTLADDPSISSLLAKFSFMIAAWAIAVFLGQSILVTAQEGSRVLQFSMRNTEFFLLSVLFSLKGYRFLFRKALSLKPTKG